MARKDPRRQASDAAMVERRRIIRRLLVEGVANGEIIRTLTLGVQLPTGEIMKVSESTARRDIAAVEVEFGTLFDDEQAADAEIGACFERYRKIAIDAAKGSKPQYHAAITALDRIVRISASRSTKWRHLAGTSVPRPVEEDPGEEIDADATARLLELRSLGDEELAARHKQLRERMAALDLQIVPGGNPAPVKKAV